MAESAPERIVHRCRSPRVAWRSFVQFPLPFLVLLALKSGTAREVAVGALLAIALFWIETIIPIDVEIGSEGVTFARLGRRRLVPYRSIARVDTRQREGTGSSDRDDERTRAWTVHLSVVFTLKDGETIEVGTGTDEVEPGGNHALGRVGDFGATDRVSRALVRDVYQHLSALRAHEPTPIEKDLARGDRSIDEWLADLSRMAEQGSGAYRAATFDKEALWAVLEDPAAEPSARAGAAVVLRKIIEPDDAPRVRVAVESCELPRLRVAVERALADDADDYREAIARVE